MCVLASSGGGACAWTLGKLWLKTVPARQPPAAARSTSLSQAWPHQPTFHQISHGEWHVQSLLCMSVSPCCWLSDSHCSKATLLIPVHTHAHGHVTHGHGHDTLPQAVSPHSQVLHEAVQRIECALRTCNAPTTHMSGLAQAKWAAAWHSGTGIPCHDAIVATFLLPMHAIVCLYCQWWLLRARWCKLGGCIAAAGVCRYAY